MDTDSAIRAAESELFSFYRLEMEESYLELSQVRLRMLSTGVGPPLLLLHGVSLSAAAWAPLIPALAGYRVHLIELPGHGLSNPVTYLPGEVRAATIGLVEDILNALHLPAAAVIGHSLGGMFALWYASERPQRITSLVIIGDPAVALPGVTVRMPLSLMTVRFLGPLFLRVPTPRGLYRYLLGQGVGRAAAAGVPQAMLEVLRLSIRRPGNAATVASLMHAINHFRRPRIPSVMSMGELGRITAPTTFIWGRDDPYLSPANARPSIAELPSATLSEVPGGHAPWFEDPAGCGSLIRRHLTDTGFPPFLPDPIAPGTGSATR
jgi:pimeloyl-ACP methyl ester carboxylesterase